MNLKTDGAIETRFHTNLKVFFVKLNFSQFLIKLFDIFDNEVIVNDDYAEPIAASPIYNTGSITNMNRISSAQTLNFSAFNDGSSLFANTTKNNQQKGMFKIQNRANIHLKLDKKDNKISIFENKKKLNGATHTSVYLSKVDLNEDNQFEADDQIPDENIDERSLSRVSSTILSRDSITSNIKLFMSNKHLPKKRKVVYNANNSLYESNSKFDSNSYFNSGKKSNATESNV